MKILHINSYYNGSSFYKNIFDYQRKDNEVVVYCHANKNSNVFIPDDSVIVSKPYSKVDKFLFFHKHKKIWDDLKKRLELNSFNLIHAHSLFANGYEAYKAFREKGTPYIVSVRNTDVNVFLKFFWYLRPLARKILYNAKSIIFLSNSYKQFVLKKYFHSKSRELINNKSVVITNGVDDYWIANRNCHQRLSDTIKVVSAGVINKNKNHLIVCRAINKLIAEGYNVSLDIYGKVIDKRIAKKFANFECVNHHNQISKEELLKKYNQSDVFVLLSKNETFGLVYAEAMTQGLPVIYTKGQGFDGQYEDGEVGFSVRSSDLKGLVKAILFCYNNYDKISKSAYEKSINYEWLSINKKIINLYNNCLRR